jgi:hypothetical protein
MAVVLAVLAAVPASAVPLPMDREPLLISIPVGYLSAKSALDGENLDAWGVGFGFQQVGEGGRWSLGASLGFATGETAGPVEGVESEIYYRSVPVSLVGRGYFVPPGRPWNAYAGIGLGASFNYAERSTSSLVSYSYLTTFSLQIPVGFMFAVSEGVALEAGYTFLWFDKSFFDDDYANLATVSVTLMR